MNQLKFRKCEYSDLEYILMLKEVGLRWYIEKIYGWDIDVQRKLTKEELDAHKDDMRIIIYEDQEVGVTTFYEENNEYVVGLIVVEPICQGKGIGADIINSYITIAKEAGKRIIIKTYKENRAKELYKRLGFKIYKEDETHLYLEILF